MTTQTFSPEIGKIIDALVKARPNFKPITKNKTVKTAQFSYDYADLPSIEEAIIPALLEQGVYVSQPLDQGVLKTVLMHVSGQWIMGSMNMSGTCAKIQETGKEITYLRRYGLCSILCISPEDDTDGNEAVIIEKKRSEPIQTISSMQISELEGLLRYNEDIRDMLLDWAQIDHIKKLPIDKYTGAMASVRKKLAEKGAKQ